MNCDIQASGGSSDWQFVYMTDLGENIDADPDFVNIINNGVSIASTSPVINAGNPQYGNNIGYNQSSDGTSIATNGIISLSVEVYPNPVDSDLTIETKELVVINYTLTTMQSVIVQSGTIENGFSTIDVSTLPHGTYILSLSTEKGIDVRQLIID